MKKLRIILLPAALILMGAAAAFATNAAKTSDSGLVPGFYYDASAPLVKCISTDQMCSTIQGSYCTWTDDNEVTHQLSTKVNNTECGTPLYKRSN